MIRWRKLLVLWLLCVTLPLQAVAALRTHCTPGTSTSAVSAPSPITRVSDPSSMRMHVAHQAVMSSDDHSRTGVDHYGEASSGDMPSHAAHTMSHATASPDGASSHATANDTYNHHASCSACAACAVCTALPTSLAVRIPGAQPSVPIPFLRTSASSADVAVPERPPKALAA